MGKKNKATAQENQPTKTKSVNSKESHTRKQVKKQSSKLETVKTNKTTKGQNENKLEKETVTAEIKSQDDEDQNHDSEVKSDTNDKLEKNQPTSTGALSRRQRKNEKLKLSKQGVGGNKNSDEREKEGSISNLKQSQSLEKVEQKMNKQEAKEKPRKQEKHVDKEEISKAGSRNRETQLEEKTSNKKQKHDPRVELSNQTIRHREKSGENWRDKGRKSSSGDRGWQSQFQKPTDSEQPSKRSRNGSGSPAPRRGGFKIEQAFKEFQTLPNKFRLDYEHVNEIQGDLFTADERHSLAHCVAEDMGMGSGIAVHFRRDFKRVDELLSQRAKTGGLAVLVDQERFIYYLVTKKLSNGKPELRDLFMSLIKMRYHIEEHHVKYLAMPRIGCGLDRLEWSDVKPMIEFVFKQTPIEITVYNFQQAEEGASDSRIYNCRVVHVSYPIEAIESGTIIIYFSSQDGKVSDLMRTLHDRFTFQNDFVSAPKHLGDIILTNRNNFILCGCIIKSKFNDDIDFKALQQCAIKILKENRKLQFGYIGFQVVSDSSDDIVNMKIINILRNTLRDVEIYVCWPGDLRSLAPSSVRFQNENLY